MSRLTLGLSVLLLSAAVAHGQILQDFHFDDAAGTPMDQAVNAVPGGGSWDRTIGGTATTGDGALRINRPIGTEQHAYLPLSETISSGLYRYIIDIRSYNLVGNTNEWFRWSVLLNQSPVEILSEARFERGAHPTDPTNNPGGVMNLSGVSFLTADGGQPIAAAPILEGGNQPQPMALALELDMTNRKYELLYKIDATSTSSDAWVSFGEANLSSRSINYIRLTASNSYAEEGEFFDVDRAYFTSAFYGDANRDGVVSIADLGILAANWQRQDEDVRFDHGDFNRDGAVTIADLGILAANWQAGAAGGVSFEEALAMFDVFEGVVIPEPATLGLLAAAGLFLNRRRRA
jgi:hypothetical protein